MTKTMSIIGNNKGYTLFEVLCAILVISIGLTYTFPSFFKSANVLTHLSRRFHAGVLLNNLVVESEDYLRENGSLEGWPSYEKTGFEDPAYTCSIQAVPADRFGQTFQLTARIAWQDSKKNELSKTVLISGKI